MYINIWFICNINPISLSRIVREYCVRVFGVRAWCSFLAIPNYFSRLAIYYHIGLKVLLQPSLLCIK